MIEQNNPSESSARGNRNVATSFQHLEEFD